MPFVSFSLFLSSAFFLQRVTQFCKRKIFLFSCFQVLTLAKKISAKWGDFNATDTDETDTPNWGFLNMKKLGHIVLGIAKEELRDLPIRGIEDVIDVLGREKDWNRGQVFKKVWFLCDL